MSKCILPDDPRCVLTHADVRKGLIYETILHVHGVGGVSAHFESSQPDSPGNMDLQSARAKGKNLS